MKTIISTASLYFWMKKYNPVKAIEIMQQQCDLFVDGIDIYVDLDDILTGNFTLHNHLKEFLFTHSDNCLHTDLFARNWCLYASEVEIQNFFDSVFLILQELNIKNLVIHGDFLYKNSSSRLKKMRCALNDIKVHLELMDENKSYFTHPDHMKYILDIDSDVFFVPDLAHMQDWEREYNWKSIFEEKLIEQRIEYVHVSHHMKHLNVNWYLDNGFNECASSVHGALQVRKENFDTGLRHALQNKKIVLEGVIPVGVGSLQQFLSEQKSLLLI